MTPLTVLAIFVFLPANAHHIVWDEMVARLQRIHDIDSLYEEIDAEGERAVVTIGIVPAVYLFSERVERFLDEHKDFAKEFGHFARRAAHLGKMYVYKGLQTGELGSDDFKLLAGAVLDFEAWVERMRQRGLVTFDPEEEPPRPDTVEHFLRLMHYFGAVFRLSFRQPDRMRYEDSDRELVVESLQVIFQVARDAIRKGEWSPTLWQTDAESLQRVLKWKREREHEEL